MKLKKSIIYTLSKENYEKKKSSFWSGDCSWATATYLVEWLTRSNICQLQILRIISHFINIFTHLRKTYA